MEDKDYFNFLYPNRDAGLPIPAKEDLFVVYDLPIGSRLYDLWSHKPQASWAFDRTNPNTCIALGSVMKDKSSWRTWGPYPMIWINRFDRSKCGRNITGIGKHDAYVEVNHKFGDISEGVWFTVNPGSGMFFDLGDHKKILVTRNKVSAYLALFPDGAQRLVTTFGDSFSWNGWGDSGTTYGKEKDYIRSTWNVHTLLDVIIIVADNSDSTLGLEWIANCPILDDWIYDEARKQGYDMIQYYNAAYNGSWSNEFVWIGSLSVDELIVTRIRTTFGPCTDDSHIALSCKFNATWDNPRDPTSLWLWLGPVLGVVVLVVICIFVAATLLSLRYYRRHQRGT